MNDSLHARHPAPWEANEFESAPGYGVLVDAQGMAILVGCPISILRHVAELHNAECVMLRRGWYARPIQYLPGKWGWAACFLDGEQAPYGEKMVMPSVAECAGHPEWRRWEADPPTALCAADEWYAANVEKGGA